MVLENIYNYPNPFSTETNFTFDFNWPNQTLDIEIRIYSFTGQLVTILKNSGIPSGFRINPIVWNGTDNGGRKLSPGMYFYKLKVNTSDGQVASGNGKVLISR